MKSIPRAARRTKHEEHTTGQVPGVRSMKSIPLAAGSTKPEELPRAARRTKHEEHTTGQVPGSTKHEEHPGLPRRLPVLAEGAARARR